uniref:Ribosome biogenesis protein NOP53 n=1 Tax=Globodera pallida TaxID=36090 RepID=A0A183BMI0_GLOPA
MPSNQQRRVHVKGSRPLSKADKLKIRQNRLIARSHPDFLEERRSKRKQFLDEGFVPRSDDDEEGAGADQLFGEIGMDRGKKKKGKRGTADEQAEQLFRDIQGDGDDDSFGSLDEGEEGVEDDDDGMEEDMTLGEVGSEADDDEDEDGAPPDEFSSAPPKFFGLEEEEEEEEEEDGLEAEEVLDNVELGSKRRKLSKKKRDALKKVKKIGAGTYRVEMGGAQFEVVSLELGSSAFASDQCADGFPPLPTVASAGRNPITFREQLLQISTAKKRSKRYRMSGDKRQKFVKH